MYIEGDSYASSLISQAITGLTNSIKNKEENVKEAYMNTVTFSTYLKKYQGNNWNVEDFDGEVVRFYDER